MSRYEPQGRKKAAYEHVTRFGDAPGYIPNAPVRDHIATLTGMGLPLASIARDAGVGYTCVVAANSGAFDNIRIRQAAAIRAVDFHPNERQQVVIAIGAARRLRALHALGWTWHAISEHCGVDKQILSRYAHPDSKRPAIDWPLWKAIHDSYEQLSGTPGPIGQSANKARAQSRRRGWAPPLDWHGHDIDDPRVAAKVSGVETRTGTAELAEWRREKVAGLTRVGFSAEEIAVRVGVSKRQVVRDRQATGARGGEWDDGTAA
jgi:hypothetical protein